VREAIATSTLFPAAFLYNRYVSKRKMRFVPERADMWDFAVLGAVMVWGVQLLSSLATSLITPVNYSSFAPIVPVLTLAIALVTRYEQWDK
jgi:hypothetical protein